MRNFANKTKIFAISREILFLTKFRIVLVSFLKIHFSEKIQNFAKKSINTKKSFSRNLSVFVNVFFSLETLNLNLFVKFKFYNYNILLFYKVKYYIIYNTFFNQ